MQTKPIQKVKEMEKLGAETAKRLITWIQSHEFKMFLEASKKSKNMRELLIVSILGCNDTGLIKKWENKNSYFADKFDEFFEKKEDYKALQKDKEGKDKQKYETICEDVSSLIDQGTMIEDKHIQQWCHIIINDNDNILQNTQEFKNNQSKYCSLFNFKWCCSN